LCALGVSSCSCHLGLTGLVREDLIGRHHQGLDHAARHLIGCI
jgi:hypothetical protein